MAKTYAQFKSQVLNKAYDIDGYYGAQCWDGAMYYSQWLGYPAYHCTTTGYAQDIWTNRKTSGILKYYDEVTYMQPGDIAVFKKTSSTPYSHIAIFDSDCGNGYGNFLGQNQGGVNGAFNICKLPYSATYDTAFRPKCFVTKTKVTTKSIEAVKTPTGTEAVYRLYNPNSGEHLYTVSITEVNSLVKAGWTYEGVGWNAPTTGANVYRLYAGKMHHFTSDQTEIDKLVKLGWKKECVAFHSGSGNEVYRLYNSKNGDHLYTTNKTELGKAVKTGYKQETSNFKSA